MKQTGKKSVVSRILGVADQGKGVLFASCVSSVLGTLAGTLPYLSVYFIARQLLAPPVGTDTQGVLLFWIAMAGGSVLANMVLSFLGSYGCHRMAFRLLYSFRVRVTEHVGKLPLGFFGSNTTGGIQRTMDENIEKIEGFVAHMLPDILGSAAVLAALVGSLFLLSPWLAVTVLAATIAGVGMQRLVFGGRTAQKLWMDVATANGRMTGAFSEYVKGIAEVKLFGLAGTVTRGLEENIGFYRTWELRSYKRSAVPMSLYKTIVLCLLVFVLPVGILLISRDASAHTLLGVLMALIITPAIYDPLMTCVNYGSQMGMLAVGLDTIDAILDTEPIAVPAEPRMPADWDVRFENVSFSYQAPDDPDRVLALDGVSFTAPRGALTALVGPSGGGKSTVGQLLSRFWDVQEGHIAIGGVDIRAMAPAALMDSVATVFQDTYLFADTVWGNITMNRPCTREQVLAAAKAARCHEFITRLPQSYDTRVGTGGASLSGGEVQRLSIARAILKDSPIVVLDEALAYADAENENLIQQAIASLVRGKTVIIIAHRLQSIRGADQILLLHSGRLTERGTHGELMAGETEYRMLWELQHEADAWAIPVGVETTEEGGIA